MKNNMIKFYKINYEHMVSYFPVADHENLFDRLEETLFIVHELCPSSRNWQRELSSTGTTMFDYHGREFCTVRLKGDEIVITLETA